MLANINNESLHKKNPLQSFFLLFGEVHEGNCKDAVEWILEANFMEEGKPEVLNFVINSPGGDLCSAMAVIDHMRGSHIPVRTIGTGQIASAGLMIFIAGKKGFRNITENTSIMSHTWSGFSGGPSHQLYSSVRHFDLTSHRMLQHYKKCTGMSEKEIKQYLITKEDVYLSAAEALTYGICDSITNLK